MMLLDCQNISRRQNLNSRILPSYRMRMTSWTCQWVEDSQSDEEGLSGASASECLRKIHNDDGQKYHFASSLLPTKLSIQNNLNTI